MSSTMQYLNESDSLKAQEVVAGLLYLSITRVRVWAE
jgi:hypothetical protein